MIAKFMLATGAVMAALTADSPHVRADGDATLELESPLTASGLALRASRTSTDLTFAIEQQLPGSLFWSVRVQGGLGSDGSTTLGRVSSGLGSSLRARIGAGWKGPLGSSASDEARCTALAHQTCIAVASTWLTSSNLLNVSAEAVCMQWRTSRTIADVGIAGEDNGRRLTAELQAHSSRSCQLLRADPRFTEITSNLGPWADSSAAATIMAISLKLDGRISQVSFHPDSADGSIDLARTRSWKQPLLGTALDVSVSSSSLGLGLGLAIGKQYTPQPVEICRVHVQGEYSVRDCHDAVLGTPRPAWQAGGKLTVVKNPLLPTWRIGDLRAGAQLTVDIASTTSQFSDLFDADSFAYRVQAPMFLARHDAPWGTRAGFAVEWTGAIGDPDPSLDDDDIRVLAFVASDYLF